jgi:hypothetical protein
MGNRTANGKTWFAFDYCYNYNSIVLVCEWTMPTVIAACRWSKWQLLQIEECRVVRATGPYSHNFDFLYQNRYSFFYVAPQLYSWGWVDSISEPQKKKSYPP